MDPETQRLLNLLKVCLRILGVTHRDLARRMGISPSYVSKLFSGVSELRLDHVVRVCRAIDLEPSEFFSLAYPRHPVGTSGAAFKLRELLQNLQLQPPPAKPAETKISDEQLQQALKDALDKMSGRAGAG
jgi:transcriptional regulator with XRE-family HTH domain